MIHISSELRSFIVIMQRENQIRSDISQSVMSDSLRPHELQHSRPPCPSPKDVFSEANHTTHGAKITTISLTSSVDAFANFITPIGKISDPFLCVLTSHSSVSGTLKLITSLFTCLLLLPSRTSVLPTHPVLPVPCRMIGSS